MKNLWILASLLLCDQIFAQCYEEIEILGKSSKPIIKGLLNGKEGYFLVDTGSDITLLHSKESKTFGFSSYLSPDHRHRVNALGTSSGELRNTSNVAVILGNQVINRRIFAYDISNIVESIYRKHKVRIVGLIGSDVMRKYDFKIDYSNGVVAIRKKKRCKEDTSGVAPPDELVAL